MKKIILFLFVISSLKIYAQSKPVDYALGFNRMAKIDDQAPASNTIEKILIQDNVIWLATSNGISKSTDNGSTWINYYNTEAFGTESVSAVGYNNGTIWASTWHYEEQVGSSVPVGTGLRYSTDQGQTWTTVPQPVDLPGDSSIVYGINTLRALPVTVNEQNFIYDFTFIKDTIYIASFAGGLRKSGDMGKNWKRVVLPPDNLDSIKPTDTLHFSLQPVAGAFGKESYLNHRVFSVLAIGDTLYVGTSGGINKSTHAEGPNGEWRRWIKFNHTNQAKPITGNFILSLRKNEFDNSIWAATWKAEGQSEFYGVSTTHDGGQSWDNYLTGENALDFGFKYFGNPGSYSNADIFVAANSGLFRSSNNGSTWISAPNVKDNVTGVQLNTRSFRCVKTGRRADGTTDIWVGSLNGLARFNETQNDFWSGTWKVFLASEKLESTTETYAFPNPFSPNREVIKIKYSTSQSADVTIRILDFGMNLVRTLIQNAPRNSIGEHLENWDGKDESGRVVPNGVYFYRVDIGSDKPLFGKIMVLM
jgi:hypothetical protein